MDNNVIGLRRDIIREPRAREKVNSVQQFSSSRYQIKDRAVTEATSVVMLVLKKQLDR